MPVTALDPKSALVVINLQKGLAGFLPAATFDPMVERSAALADAFRARDLPVVLVTADGVAHLAALVQLHRQAFRRGLIQHAQRAVLHA